MSGMYSISDRAKINPNGSTIGPGTNVQAGVEIGRFVSLGAGVQIGVKAMLSGYSYIGDHVAIGPRTSISQGAFIMNGAQICVNDVISESSNARELGMDVIVGSEVVLDDEAELGDNAVVPTQRTIAFLGKFGAKNRVVTIYGSDDGPRYSVGCQKGVDLATFRTRAAKNTSTDASSADTYKPFFPAFNEVGLVVQREYEREAKLVAELKVMHDELVPGDWAHL